MTMPINPQALQRQISVPVYAVLVADLAYDEIAAVPAAQAVIWRAIDRLLETGGARRQVGVLESISRELHALRHERRDPAHVAQARLRALTRDWLECAPLLG